MARPNSSSVSTGDSVEIDGMRSSSARPLPHHHQVEGADLDDVGAADLHRHDAAVGQARLVHLRHRRRGDRDRRELREDGRQRAAEVALDGADDVLERERADVVLQLGERGRDVLGDEVGPGAHDLADLDEGGAQLAEQVDHHLTQPGAPPRLARTPQPEQPASPTQNRVPCLANSAPDDDGARRPAASGAGTSPDID